MLSLRLTPLALLALLACGPPPAAPPPAPVTVPAPEPEPAFSAGAWGTFHSERFGLRIPLPEGKAWRIDDHHGPWLEATHAAEGSTLLVRSWTEDGRATRTRCEAQARLWRPLPERPSADVMQERSIAAPEGFDTQIVIAVVPGKAGAPLAAFALAFGAHAHRCFAWAYTTSAAGAGAGRVLGERLAAMVERSLGKVVLENELVPKIGREPAGPPAR